MFMCILFPLYLY